MTDMSPYSEVAPGASWRNSVAEAGIFGMTVLWRSGWTLPSDARFATYGPCFSQHISRARVKHHLGWLDAEPPPPAA